MFLFFILSKTLWPSCGTDIETRLLTVEFCWAKREVERREGHFLGKDPRSPLKQGGYGPWQRPCDCSGGVTGDKGKVRLEKDTYT